MEVTINFFKIKSKSTSFYSDNQTYVALLLSSNVAEFLSGPRPCWLNVPRAVIARAVVVILLLPATWLLLLLLFVRNELDRFHLLERVVLS